MQPLLSLHQVQTYIGLYHILQGVDFAVEAGSITALLGRNGAGKTTTLRTIIGHCPPRSGTIELGGTAIEQLKPADTARMGVGYVPEDMGIFADLTVSENMKLAARGLDHVDSERQAWILDLFPPLKQFWQKPAGVLSGGQKQMLAVARSLALPQKLLLLDEPTKGLAPSIVASFADVLGAARKDNTTVLLVEQNFAFASQVAEHAIVMDDGKIVHAGSMSELANDSDLLKRLLGL